MTYHLVTGGAGFIGSALVHRLLEEGHRVAVLDRLSRGKRERLPPEARVTRADIRDENAVSFAVARAEVIWHLAYVQGTQTFYADPRHVISVALRGIMNVLDACATDPGKDLILLSSSEAYQVPPAGMFPTDETVPLTVPDVTNPRYSYGAGKIASEVAVFAYADVLSRVIIARPHNVYGPDMGYAHVIPEFAVRMKRLVEESADTPGRLPFPIQGSGEETRSFCYITDCIDALMTLYEHGENRTVYHVGNPWEEHPIRDVAHRVADFYGRKISLEPGVRPQGSPTRRLPDIQKLLDLGHHPGISLEEGLDPTLRWYDDHVRVPA